jgi:hypothetical protein
MIGALDPPAHTVVGTRRRKSVSVAIDLTDAVYGRYTFLGMDNVFYLFPRANGHR